MSTTTYTEAEAADILAWAGYRPDDTGKYWGWDGAGYGYLTARDLLALLPAHTCASCGRPTRNPHLCIDCVNDAEAGDVPY